MLGFAKIAGGAPSTTASMGNHLMNQTLSPEQARLAAYYGRGMVQEPLMLEIAQEVADGDLLYSNGVAELYQNYLSKAPPQEPVGPDNPAFWEPVDAAEQRLAHRLDVLSERIAEGLMDAPLAVVRPDAHPFALAGLGIEADGLLSKDEVNALLAGRRSDGELIEGKHYAEERQLPVNPKTREERVSTPIGSYDFCPTPDKTVSVAGRLPTRLNSP